MRIDPVSAVNFPYGQQDRDELDWLISNYVQGVGSILEVGSCWGHTLVLLAHAARPGALVRSIDLGHNPRQDSDVTHELNSKISTLNREGYDAKVLFKDSHSLEAKRWADKWAPYDFVFIDGDHSKLGVLADWSTYGQMGHVVGFHDVKLLSTVKVLWDRIKTSGLSTFETNAGRYGIGIIDKR